jgi:hypothetical protein
MDIQALQGVGARNKRDALVSFPQHSSSGFTGRTRRSAIDRGLCPVFPQSSLYGQEFAEWWLV